MHFLCLHGAGTNSGIFEAQTAALRYELGGDHTYDFVEGVMQLPKASAIDKVVTGDLGYFGYYKPNDCNSFHKALDDLELFIQKEGPFDGVIGFSQGASLASALLLRNWSSGSGESDAHGTPTANEPPFKCAVFLSGYSPYDYTCIHVQQMQGSTISIPTAHIWGVNERGDSGGPPALKQLCNPQIVFFHEHEGGHEVPGARNKPDLIESANIIKRMLTRL
ncbi:hypothetical protein EYB25_002977 [Talaromyces marneffei]|uniref:Ovarian cancer-associated gene 2 protein like n=1 Tax=Talaromyces marneffei PM1 TaxID=1077442 RepID=A0A093UUY9_TALMA|nr:uncharacterized protein EYB26_005482 [Talaromyces marneffei]KAE8554438.1 hypothetical protein EYB25_002977 [Talaromyces marneffei]QGA17806.1 hypothetical protein EYB26_005482 [Talaromyces marneffei]